MKLSTPIVKDLVLIGGGHSHVEVLRRFGMRPMPGVRLTLISRGSYSPYSGMLPGLIAGHYVFEETHIDVRRLARFANARFYPGEVVGLDLDAREVTCADRPPVPYDVLSINVGSAPNTSDIPGAAQHTVPVKPISRFHRHWERMRDRTLESGGRAGIGVVGGGAGGVEIALAIQYRLRQALRRADRDPERPEFHLITAGDEILETHNRGVRRKFLRTLRERGIRVHTDRAVVRVEPGRVHCADGSSLELDEILWVITAAAPDWPREAGLDVDPDGFIQVDSALRSTSHPEVFAAGDIAAVVGQPRPKAGVFAVRQGPPLTENLRRALLGRPLKRFAPQRKFLSLISTGDRHAIASRGRWALEGDWVWRWKDWIDRRWMRRYRQLPVMEAERPPDLPEGLIDDEASAAISSLAMRCAGCGGKVGGRVLERALAAIQTRDRDDVLVGLEGHEDAAVLDAGGPDLTVLSVDAFRPPFDDPYTFAKVAANHCLGDLFAMGAMPQSALAIVTLPYALERKAEDDLRAIMMGAAEVFNDAGASLVGGHTAEGAEASLGFAVTGTVGRERLWRKGGLRPGDRLILTQPIGTGTLFAAAMRLRAKGRWIDGAIESMLRSSADAARCLREHEVRACTDVTGFGLAGHLLEMLRASEVQVTLDLDAVPLLDGALETVEAGVFSSLHPANLRLGRTEIDAGEAALHPKYPLLFDPQTAGGLLAGVPATRADECVAELRRRGYEAASIIGVAEATGGKPVRVRRGGEVECAGGGASAERGASFL